MKSDTIDIVGLIFSCPFGKETDLCPLKEYRQKNIKKAIDLFENLSSEEAKKIKECHRKCLKKREGG